MEEGESLLIDLSARANPPQIEYKWTNPDRLSVPEAADALPGTRNGRMHECCDNLVGTLSVQSSVLQILFNL